MNTAVKTAPSQGQAKALSLEQQVNQQLAIVWKDLAITHFRSVFAQERTCLRFIDVTSGMLFAVARRKTVTASIVARGNGENPTWDADYWLFREAVWNPEDMFRAVLDAAVPLIPSEGPIVIAIDDTALPKVGCKPSKTSSREGASRLAGWCHNPLAPPWQHPAIQWGHKMFHAVLIIPTRLNGRATGITLAFEPIPDPPEEIKKKRRKKKKSKGVSDSSQTEGSEGEVKKRRGRPNKAEVAARAAAKALVPEYPKNTDLASMFIRRVRGWLDQHGLSNRHLVIVGDGSYTNATVLTQLPERTTFVGRVSPGANLRHLGEERPDGTHRYGDPIGNLRLVARDANSPSTTGEYWAGGDRRELKVKQLDRVLRPGSTRKMLLRVFMLVPQKYGPVGDRDYSQEAFLLTSDLTTPMEVLIQAYLDRWSIEVTHRDMKFHVGVGHAQVSTTQSVRRTHAAVAAAWALLQIAALKVCGQERTDELFGKLTAWQRRHRDWRTRKRLAEGKSAPVFRPTAPDILSLFRQGHGVLWTNRQVPFRI